MRNIQARSPRTGVLATEEGALITLSPESHYLVAAQPLPGLRFRTYLGKASTPRCSDELCPATVFHLDTPASLQSKILTFRNDTEFEPCFLEIAIIAFSEKVFTAFDDVIKGLSDFGRRSVLAVHGSVPEGPCFVQGQSIYRTWRLFPDVYEAFQLPTLQDANSDSFTGVSIMREGKLMVPVPSRLHYPRTAQKPLNGVRVTVKDIIDLKGVKTTGQSRSYEKLYGPRDETAAIVTRLTELGAVIIGKTKCTQFASSDQPTADWVDYHCPWNPRGDGYLSPRGSSTGTCVALAGYDWCDVGIGSDSNIRGPAAIMGLFALRPTHSPDYLPGILPVAEARIWPCGIPLRKSIFRFQWTRPTSPSPRSPRPGTTIQNIDTKPVFLLYPSNYWDQWPQIAARTVMEGAVEKLEAYLGVKRVVVNLAEKWLEDDPSQSGLRLEEFLQNTFMTLLWRGYYTNYLPFRKEYEAKFGIPPYVHPVIQSCWRHGKALSAEDIAKAHERKRIYAKWLREAVFGGDGFNAIMVYPVGDIDPFYRDVYRKSVTFPARSFGERISPNEQRPP
ncbi:amidase signature domain-containing protein [Achaetomium macrosporum]|uniref:Amidase signature domain-containing protein n=1 Tax=Achaetomium macrosporum TaxID=79813 RepID=A0AAN7CHP2_9PEZI|nr:amidase signature domain-containing protein [Achaetomium macrosporum]